tara:strand:+ start:992 stop:1186 length:195 start_codon:yes stop_codon:yes gene_type:complete
MPQGNDKAAAWDQYYAAAVIAISAKAATDTGSALDALQNTQLSIASRAALLADSMMKERQKRFA